MRKIVLSVSQSMQSRSERDAFLAQAGGFAVAPALSIESALQKIETLPFCAVILGPSLSLEEKHRFMSAVRGRKHFSVISIRRNGEVGSGADLEIESQDDDKLLRAIHALAA